MKKNYLFLILIAISVIAKAQIIEQPALPQNLCDVIIKMPDTSGYNRVTVGLANNYDFHDLQTAFDAVQPGTILLLAPDTFLAPIDIGKGDLYAKIGKKNNPNNKYIIVMPELYQYLPTDGMRLNPEAATGNSNYPKVKNTMPHLVTSKIYSGHPTFSMDAYSSYWVFIGLDIFTHPNPNYAFQHYDDLVQLGAGGHYLQPITDSLQKVPHHILIDRCYFHCEMNPKIGKLNGIKRAIGLNSGQTAVVNCYFSNLVCEGFEAACIQGWTGPGQYRIINNFMESAGINFILGGAWIYEHIGYAKDIEFRNNHCYKRPQWNPIDPSYDGSQWCVKNNFELKQSARSIIEGNIFENCWYGCYGQKGFGALLTIRSYQGGPANELLDITFQNNIFKNTEQGISIAGLDDVDINSFENAPHPPGYVRPQGKRWKIANNLFLLTPKGTTVTRAIYQCVNIQDLIIDHNTAIHTDYVDRGLTIGMSPSNGGTNLDCSYTNNIQYHHGSGVSGDFGSSGAGPALASVWPDVTDANQRFNKNILAKTSWIGNSYYENFVFNSYPNTISKNYLPHWDSIFFVDSLMGQTTDIRGFKLANNSPYKNAGTDGKDIGANLDDVYNFTKNVIAGNVPLVDVCSVLGIKQNNNTKMDNIFVYPNPANNEIYILGTNKLGLVELFDATGRTMLNIETFDTKININTTNLSNGFYYIKTLNSTKKIVIYK